MNILFPSGLLGGAVNAINHSPSDLAVLNYFKYGTYLASVGTRTNH